VRSVAAGIGSLPGRLRLGLLMVLLVVVAGIFAGVLDSTSPNALNLAKQNQAPSLAFPMGTDNLGRDVLSRSLHAIRVDLPLAIGGIGLGLVLGISLGMLTGITRGPVDAALGRFVDGVQAFPALLLAILTAAALGASTKNLILIIGIVSAPVFFRLARTQAITLVRESYVEVARALRRGWVWITLRHLLPNSLPALLAQASIGIGYAVLLAAGLGFLGLGPRPPTSEWGSMIASGSDYLTSGQWWQSVFPGVLLAFTVVAFALIADGIQERIDPDRG
jgi:peptide/nickel transport system permease protein